MEDPRVIVCQNGSRHRYAIPRLLWESGMLKCLYTDLCADTTAGRWAKRLARWVRSPRIQRLAARTTGLPPEFVHGSDATLWRDILTRGRRQGADWWQEQYSILAREMIRWGVDDCNVVFSMNNEYYEFVRYAKEQGRKVVIDVYITPLTDYQVAYDEWRNGDRSSPPPRPEDYQTAKLRECLELADVISCPSSFVRDGVVELYPQLADKKIVICPYGSSIDYGGRRNEPERGRFFFAGRLWVRKGLRYLAAAADILRGRYPDMDFRVAGILEPEVQAMPEFKNLHFIGKLDRNEMIGEFMKADAFVMPSISEGMASVCVEALCAGCPIIVPTSAGIDPVNGVFGGILLDELSGESVAAAMEEIYHDRDLRSRLSDAALTQSANYTTAAWKERLAELMRQL